MMADINGEFFIPIRTELILDYAGAEDASVTKESFNVRIRVILPDDVQETTIRVRKIVSANDVDLESSVEKQPC